MTHIYAVHVDGEVVDGDGVHVACELHLQHPLEAPAHEGHIGDPRGHCGVTHTRHILNCTSLLPLMFHFHLLTEPHVLHVDDEASRQVEDGEQGVAHEG